MEKITMIRNRAYTIFYCPSKNRIFLRIIGYWPNPQSVPNYLEDWKKVLAQTSSGFTLLTYTSEMMLHPKKVAELHEKAQEMVLNAGVVKVAEIVKSPFVEVQLKSEGIITRFPKRNFKIREEAEKWLDSTMH